MPISNKDLGKYKRPGIIINEIDDSFITLPVQDILINLVPGFSKKGPVNTPVRVNSVKDFESIYGPIDKNLENKGSYFHRTVEDMLQKGPVWALNLLTTSPTRDLLGWESLSVAAQYDNGTVIESPYERFFNRQDFWERDVESFMDIVDETYIDNINQPNPDHNLFSITNMGDKKFTLFTFKSSATGFDVTAESWYGGADKVPLFMNKQDWISDYMISVLAVGGDFTDYATLSVDTYWGQYFNTKGLLKSKISDFVNDRLTSVVAYYDVSLIPNFRDANGLDMYIKNVINSNTDKTGLFCYYNEDVLLNADAYKGNIDIIGQTLVGSSKKTINFMSYKGSISETLRYSQKYLDATGNVFGNYGSNMTSDFTASGRTAEYTNWWTNLAPTATDYSYIFNVISISAGVVSASTIGTETEVDDIIYFNKSFSIIDSSTPYYVTAKNSSTITVSNSKGGSPLTGINSGTTTGIFVYTFKKKLNDTVTATYNYQIGDTQYTLDNLSLFFDPFVITNSAQTQSRYDVVYLSTDSSTAHTLKGTASTSTPSLPNYLLSNTNTIILGYILNSYKGYSGNNPVAITSTYTGVTTTTGYNYYTATGGYTIVGTTSTSNSALTLTFVGTSGTTVYSDYYKLRIQKIFSEISTKMLLGKSVIINVSDGSKYNIDSNYFISNATTTSNAYITITFDSTHNPSDYYSANGYFVIYYVDDEFVLPTEPTANIASIQTTELPVYPMSSCVYGVAAKYSTFYLAYYNGEINNLDYFWEYNSGSTDNKYYLRMYVDSSKRLLAQFSLNDPTATPTYITNWPLYGEYLDVYSDNGNWKQTIEIENASAITDETNVNYIYVNNDRYGEISKGWFLEAYYDASYYDSPGEGYQNGFFPRKFVRVTSTARDTVDSTYKIIYTDGPIKISSYSGITTTEKYTTAYKSIDNYFDQYNGVAFSPFIISPESIPDGTDLRLDSIMSVIDKSTNLAKGLANKNRISWRYLVDSFGLGLTSNSKQEYLDLCGMKLNCFGFINMPSARQFKTSVNPSFINDDRTINTEYIKEGGDPTKNPSFLYSFGDGVGRSTVGYFFPYVKDVNDATKFVPPASKVAMAYMNKFTGGLGAAYPWQIIAGPQFSTMKNVSAVEMRFTDTDLENFYSMGANPIVYSLNRGYNINSESTAQVYPVSSLSYIHSREVLIELENRLYDMLLNYHWRFNTPEIRAEIKFRADQICKELLDTNALYDFKNVCDKTNNTDYIIDLQMGVLDTYIEIIKGMGIIVNNITILKKGTIASGGFLPTA